MASSYPFPYPSCTFISWLKTDLAVAVRDLDREEVEQDKNELEDQKGTRLNLKIISVRSDGREAGSTPNRCRCGAKATGEHRMTG